MKKVIGIIRNECGTILNLVMFDTDSRKKYSVSAPANAEVLFGSYPIYNEKMEVIENKGLIILEKTDTNMKLISFLQPVFPHHNAIRHQNLQEERSFLVPSHLYNTHRQHPFAPFRDEDIPAHPIPVLFQK